MSGDAPDPAKAAAPVPDKAPPTSTPKVEKNVPLQAKGEDFWALRATLPPGTATVLAILGPALLLGLWIILSYGGVVKARDLPSPVEVLRSILDLWFNKGLLSATWVSTHRILIAFGLAVAIAMPLGVLMGAFEPINRLFDPVVAPFRYMPISAFIPLMVVWFGIYEKQKIAFLWLGVFVYLLPVVVTAIRAVPDEYVQTAYTLGASRARVVLTVLVPAALPDIFDAFRVMNAISWTYIVLAEQVNMQDPPGLGYIVQVGMGHSRPGMAFAVLIVIGAIGIGTDAIINGLNRVLFRWREKA